jgi:hypothetical protein
MNTKLVFTILAFCLLGTAKAQHFDKSKVKGKNQTYNVKISPSRVKSRPDGIDLENEKNQFKKPNYREDTLNLSGLLLKEAQIEATEKIKKYLIQERKISLETLPNVGTEWMILKNGEVKEVRFSFSKNTPLTPDDFEEMEKIITQTKVKVTQPQLYKSVNFIPIHLTLFWNKPLR